MHLPILFQLREWNKEAEKRKPQNKSPSLFRCIVRMFGVQYALLGIIVFIEVGQIHTVLYLQCKPTFICDDFFSWSIHLLKINWFATTSFFAIKSHLYACVVFNAYSANTGLQQKKTLRQQGFCKPREHFSCT